MTSAVDATIPKDNEKVDKNDVRTNFLTIKNEITALQQRTGVVGCQTFFDIPSQEDIRRIVRQLATTSLARDTAYSRVSIKAL